jgi:CDP-glucose 4,6-dehydratase
LCRACGRLYLRSFVDPQADGPRLAGARADNVIGGGDWGEDRLIRDIVRAALGRGHCDPQSERRPALAAPAQPASGYLPLAEALAARSEAARGWNFGPPAHAKPASWLTDRIGALWPEDPQ